MEYFKSLFCRTNVLGKFVGKVPIAYTTLYMKFGAVPGLQLLLFISYIILELKGKTENWKRDTFLSRGFGIEK